MAHCDVGDVRLFYTDEGDRDPPLVLVHGWTCDSQDWIWQFDPLVRHHRVVALDLRGHGRSTTPDGGYEPFTMAADVAALVRSLDLSPAAVIGHSMGALVCSVLAVEHPELVRAVVAVEPAYGLGGEVADTVPSLCAAIGGAGGLDVVAAVLGGMEGPTTPDALRAWHRRRVAGMDQRVVAGCAQGMYIVPGQFGLRPASTEYLRNRTCPTLSIWASAEAAGWERTLMAHPADSCIGWEAAGHWLHQERPDDFNDLVLRWLRDLPPTVEADTQGTLRPGTGDPR